MIGEIIQCERAGCTVKFPKKTHNQRYHDDECCRLATNAKIMEKYYQRRAQRLGIARHCDHCGTRLSRYNSSEVCNACLIETRVDRNSSVAATLMAVAQ